MPHRIEIIQGQGLRVAPGVTIDAGDLQFQLFDSEDIAIAGADVEFHVAFGGGSFQGANPGPVIVAQTDADGKVSPPEFQLGPDAGPQGIFAQSMHATLEFLIVADYGGLDLAVEKPVPADRDSVAGKTLDLRVVALDTGYKNRPVPDLPLEFEVTSGAATIEVSGGAHGHYELCATSFDGAVNRRIALSRWGEDVEVSIRPYRHRRDLRQVVRIHAKTPAINHYSRTSFGTAPQRSVVEPVRLQVSDRSGNPNAQHPGRIDGLFAFAEEPNKAADLHPPACRFANYAVSTFLVLPRKQGAYAAKVRLPDYPSTVAHEAVGDARAPYEGNPVVTVPTVPNAVDYIQSSLGGDWDRRRFMEIKFIGGEIQYLGPNAATAIPIRVSVEVTPGPLPRRLVEAYFKFKVRLSPWDSSVDNPQFSPTAIPGKVASSAAGAWGDFVELTMPGSAGIHWLDVFFQSNERNYDHLVDVTARAKISDVDAQGNVVETIEETTLQLRAGVLRPRVYLVRQDGSDYPVITDSGIRPVTLTDRAGAQLAPPATSAFYVEMRCHDIGQTVKCMLRGVDEIEIELEKLAYTTDWKVYRSKPCYAYIDDRNSGAAIHDIPGMNLLYVNADHQVEAYLDKSMPGNTAQPRWIYSSAKRPVSTVDRIAVGDAMMERRIAPPLVHVALRDDATWTAAPAGADPMLEIAGVVWDPCADFGAAAPELTINGTAVAMTGAADTVSFGRPSAWKGTFKHSLKAVFGVQSVTVRATASAKVFDERVFRVEVTEASNNVAAPQSITARVQPIGHPAVHPLPWLEYLYASGTFLGTGVPVPPSINAEVTTLEPAPSTVVVQSLPLTLTQRPSQAVAYASPVFMTLRKDLKPAGAAVPANTLSIGAGGRTEWRAPALPNILGPLNLTNRILVPEVQAKLLRKAAAGAWEVPELIVAGDSLRVEAAVTGSAPPSIQALLIFVNASYLAVAGPQRGAMVSLKRTSAGAYAMEKYWDGTQMKPAAEIAVLAEFDEIPAGLAPLRIQGHGRILCAESPSRYRTDVDVPAFVRPARHDVQGQPLPQEGLRPGVRRLGARETVVAGTGEAVVCAADRHLPGREIPAAFERTYRSGNNYAGPLGHGWNASWNVFLWKESDTEMRLLQGDGQIVVFSKSAAGAWDPPPGLYGRLEELAGCFRLIMPGRALLTFLPAGSSNSRVFTVAAFEDRFRNRLNYRYASHGRICFVTDTLSRTFQLRFERVSGRLRGLGDFSGCEVAYSLYGAGDADGAEGNLKSVRTPIVTNADDPFPDGRVESYGYCAATDRHRIQWVQDPVGGAQTLKKLIGFSYDADGRIETQTWLDGTFSFKYTTELAYTVRKGQIWRIELYPAANGLPPLPSAIHRTVSGVDIVTRYVYNTHGEIRKRTFPMGHAVEIAFDETAADPCDRGNALEIKRVADGVRPTTATRTVGMYNPANDPTTVNLTELVQSFTYIAGLQVIETSTDTLGRVTTDVYEDGMLVRETLPAVTQGGTHGAPQTPEWRYERNRWNQLLKQVDPNGVVTTTAHYAADDPAGLKGKATVSGKDTAGGFPAYVESDVPDPRYLRSGLLAPVRTLKEERRYDERGNLVELKDPLGGATTFTYNELNELILKQEPGGAEMRNRYDGNGKLRETVQKVEDVGFPAGVTAQPSRSERTVYTFNRLGQLTSVNVDADGLALTTRWDYDKNDNMTDVRSPVSQRAVTPRPDNRTRYDYDDADRRTRETHAPGTAAEAFVRFEHDLDGHVVLESQGGLWSRIYVHDGLGRLVARQTEMASIVFDLDEADQIARVRLEGSVDGDPAHREQLQEIVHYFDEGCRMIAAREAAFEVLPDPGSPSGFTAFQIGSGFNVTRHAYDAAGNEVQSSDRLGVVTSWTVDGHGCRTAVGDGNGASAIIVYDGLNRPVQITETDQLGVTSIVRTYNAGNQPEAETIDGRLTQKIFYDTLGRPRLREDALGNRVEVQFDGAGRRTKTLHYLFGKGRRVNDDGSENPLRATWTSRAAFDENGNVLESFDFYDRVIEKFEYDDRNAVRSRTLPEDKFTYFGKTRDDNPGPSSYVYSYRKDGLTATVTLPTGNVVTSSYDQSGMLSGRKISNPAGTPVAGTTEEQYKWDGAGRLIEGRDDNGFSGKWVTVEQRHTSLGGTVSSIQSENMKGPATNGVVHCSFETDGRPNEIIYPRTARVVVPSIDVFGNTTRVSDTHSAYADYGYHGRYFSWRSFANGMTYGFGYNNRKQVREIRTYTGSNFTDDAAMVNGHRYTYNRAGMTETDWDLEKTLMRQFFYDSLYRQPVELYGYTPTDPNSVPAGGTWNVFDRLGNLLRSDSGLVAAPLPDGRQPVVRGAVIKAEYNDANQTGYKHITQYPQNKPPYSYSQDFKYDPAGNLIDDGFRTYVYDYKSRLIEVALKTGGSTHRFYYDVLDRRVRKDNLRYYWHGTNLIEEQPDGGAWFKRFVYSGRPGELIAYETNIGGVDRRYFYHAGLNGSIEFLTDETGAIVEKYSFEPNALPKALDKDDKDQPAARLTGNPFLMHGQYWDDETKTYSVGARAYHPWLGRFMQRDPNGALDDPLAYGNAYTYAGNNPAAFSDRSGQASDAAIAGAQAAESAKGLGKGLVILVVAQIALGPLGLLLASLALFSYAYYNALEERFEESKLSGRGITWSSFGAAVGDMFGISALIESYTGRRINSGFAITHEDRVRSLTHGTISTALFAISAVKGARGYFRAKTITVELAYNKGKSPAGVIGEGHMHLVVRLVLDGGRRILSFSRTRGSAGKNEGLLLMKIYEGAAEIAKARAEYPTAAQYEVPRSAVYDALGLSQEPFAVGNGPIPNLFRITEPALSGYFKYTRNCSTLPGELGLGLRIPFAPPAIVATLHTLAFTGNVDPGVLAGAANGRPHPDLFQYVLRR